MIYPEFLKKGSTIGIAAPSAGVGHKLEDFDASLAYLKEQGWKIRETASVRNDDRRSTDAEGRGKELTSLFTDPAVDFVMCATGGDFLDECLPYVDFKAMKRHPKWLMGASDPTGILYPLTVKYDVATIYGLNAGSYSEKKQPEFVLQNISLLKGRKTVQKNFARYMSRPRFAVDRIRYDRKDVWKSSVDSLHEEGRCIGGCIDVLKDLIGTEFDGTKKFLKRYQEDGFIWYFDNFSLSAEVLYRTFLQMRYAGWFKGAKAVIVGRTLFESSETGMDYNEAVERAFPDIPVLWQADIGHTLPHMTMINGAVLDLRWKDQKAELRFNLR